MNTNKSTPDYIEVQPLLRKIHFVHGDEFNEAHPVAVVKLNDIQRAPSADVKKVVRAEWVIKNSQYCCSNCDTQVPLRQFDGDIENWFSKICPECGAIMK